ncbi:MAG: hypothetical protein NTX35_18825 [Verrucomicrobia bacterium]|nr:hypothetical protein [Verrucomicrobiota bacterium]
MAAALTFIAAGVVASMGRCSSSSARTLRTISKSATNFASSRARASGDKSETVMAKGVPLIKGRQTEGFRWDGSNDPSSATGGWHVLSARHLHPQHQIGAAKIPFCIADVTGVGGSWLGGRGFHPKLIASTLTGVQHFLKLITGSSSLLIIITSEQCGSITHSFHVYLKGNITNSKTIRHAIAPIIITGGPATIAKVIFNS